MTQEAFEGVIAALEANKKAAANSDCWEAAISIVKEHAKAWQSQPSYISGWNDALRELEKAVERKINGASA